MNNCYIFSKNKIDCIYIFLYASEQRIYQFLSKKTQKIKNENSYFPRGGFEPTTLGFEVHCLDQQTKRTRLDF